MYLQIFPTVKDCINWSCEVWNCDGYTLTCVLCCCIIVANVSICIMQNFFELNHAFQATVTSQMR